MMKKITKGKIMKTIIDEETGELIEVEETNDIALRKANEIVNIDKVVELYEAMEIAKASYDNYVKEFKKQLLDYLRTLPKGEQKIVSKYITFTRKNGYLKETFNAKEFKKAYPDLYKKFVAVTAVDETLVIKENKQG